MNQKQTYLIIIVILLIGNIFLGAKYFNTNKELKKAITITAVAQEERTKFT